MKDKNILYIVLGVVGGYFAYSYAVRNGIIPDYFGLMALINGDEVVTGGPNVLSTGAQTGNQINTGAPAVKGESKGGTAKSPGAITNTIFPGGSVGQSTTPKDALWNAAKSDANANGGRLHFWQWNHFLPSQYAKPDPFVLGDMAWAGTPLGRNPISTAEVVNTPLTLDQYWSMVSGPLGLSGMGTVNHWGMQSSVWQGGMGSTGRYGRYGVN